MLKQILCCTALATISCVAAGQSTAPALVQDVKTFGAKGDGTADDAPAIQRAIESLPVTGGTILVPGGTYLIRSSIMPTRRVRIVGQSPLATGQGAVASSTIKKASVMHGPAIDFSSPDVQGSSLENIAIDGEAGNTGDGVLVRTNSVLLRDVIVTHQGGDGVRIGEDAGVSNQNSWSLERVRLVANRRHGLYVHSSSLNANAGVAINLVAQKNGGDGILLGNTTSNVFVNPLCEENTGAGLHATNPAGMNNGYTTVIGGDLNEANRGGNLVREPGTYGYYFVGTGAVSGTKEPDDNGVGGIYVNNMWARFGSYNGVQAARIDAVGNTFSGVKPGAFQAFEGNYAIDGKIVLHAHGQNNTFVGIGAGNLTLTGSANVASGAEALHSLQTGSGNVAIGQSAASQLKTGTGNIFIGANAGGSSSTASSLFVAGSEKFPINEVFFGKGESSASPSAYRINGTRAEGANRTGADLVMAGGAGTGAAPGGAIRFQVSLPGTTGTDSNALSEVARIDTHGLTANAVQVPTPENTDLAGELVLDQGKAQYRFKQTYKSGPVCVLGQPTGHSIQWDVTTAVLSATGSAGDRVSYICIGRH